MIDSAKDYAISSILKTDSNVRYIIPKYQRRYTWARDEWEALFDDVFYNGKGHFLGSIICINTTKDVNAKEQCVDLVDGQQRLTTISLLYAAIHTYLVAIKSELNEDQQDDLRDVKRRLSLKYTNNIRVSPSYHGNNHDDYLAVLCKSKVIEGVTTPSNAGNRRMFKAYRYFLARLEEKDKQEQSKLTKQDVLDLLDRLNNAIVVKIEVSTHADAYTLFESLNNRGVPLSAIDLIKNKLLSALEKDEVGSLDQNFQQWNSFLELLTDNFSVQERFLRQFYNAFRHRDEIAVDKIPIATKSKIILIYQTLIDRDAKNIFSELRLCAQRYSRLISPEHDDNSTDLTTSLVQLERIGGAPSYTFLLHALTQGASEEQLIAIVNLLVCFFVKRSVTDQPPTRDLDRMFMDLSQATAGQFSVQAVSDFIRSRSATEERFRQDLGDDMYENNSAATRFVLCALEESQQTKETFTDLWARGESNQFIWTIEHIFPQGKTIPEPWVEMTADGDVNLANEHRETYVHKLGNLTITGFNSQLSNMSFEKKRDRKGKDGKVWGFKNGLALNEALKDATSWSVEDIRKRTKTMVDNAVALFDYDNIELGS